MKEADLVWVQGDGVGEYMVVGLREGWTDWPKSLVQIKVGDLPFDPEVPLGKYTDEPFQDLDCVRCLIRNS